MAKKKKIETVCFIVIIIIILTIGYNIYKSYQTQKEENSESVKIDNYYTADYLFNNNYITKAKTIENFDKNKGIYMYLDKENIFYIKNIKDKTNKNKHISNLPKEKLTIYYNNLYNDYYEFVALTEKEEVYYAKLNINSKKDYKFKKVGENITNIYMPSYDKKNMYINKNKNIITNFIFLDTNNNLRYLDFDDEYVLKTSLQTKKPYFDYICAFENTTSCKDLIIYENFEKNLIFKGKEILGKNREKILVKEMFGTIKKDEKNNKYMFTVYLVDEQSVLYKIEINENTIKNKKEIKPFISSDIKVKQLNYTKENGKKIVEIIYENGKKEKVIEEKNKQIVTSTIYDKTLYNIIDKTKKGLDY